MNNTDVSAKYSFNIVQVWMQILPVKNTKCVSWKVSYMEDMKIKPQNAHKIKEGGSNQKKRKVEREENGLWQVAVVRFEHVCVACVKRR